LGDRGFNADNQFTISIALYDGKSTPIAYNGNGAPGTVPLYSFTEAGAYDPEDRLTNLGSSTSPDFYARYDGDGLRAWSNVLFSALIYTLNDDDRAIEEEDYTGSGSAFNLFGATGM
jgi:hypothetical protein